MVENVNSKIYTLGYSGFSIEKFIETLKSHKIRALIDVRSKPYSAYFSDYNEASLKAALKKYGILYKNYATEFGAQQTNRQYYYKDYLDFDLFALSPEFQCGVKKVEEGIKQGYSVAFMCAEKKPTECHRSIMITKFFYRKGFDIIHLLPDGKTLTQKDIENSLLEKYFPTRRQMSFFENLSEDELIQRAYQKRNEEIGYRKEESYEFI